MLRYIADNLTTMNGVEIFPMISLLIFVIFFVGLFWWVFTADKKYINKMSNYPLDDK